MKKLLFIIALFACATAFSQTSPSNQLQAPKAMKQCLDSVIVNNIDNSYYNTQKFLFTYDSKGNVLTLISYLKMSNIIWVLNEKQENKYNDNGNRIERIAYVWDVDEETWNKERKDSSNYDGYGNKILNTIYVWDTDKKDWIEDSYNKLEYDHNKNIILDENHVWNADKKDWEKSSKWEYGFDLNGFISKRAFYWAANNVWIPSGPTFYENDNFGNILQSINYSWNGDTIVENNKEIHEYTFFEGSNKIKQKYHEYHNWNAEENDWVISSKDKTEYDKHGNEILSENSFWDYDIDDWGVSKNKFDFTYDLNDNYTKKIAYFWDCDSNKWFEMYKEENDYTYSGTGKITRWILEWYSWEDKVWVISSKTKSDIEYDDNGNEIMKEDYYWDFDKKDWVGSDKNNFLFDLSYAISDLVFYDEGIPQTSFLEKANMLLEEKHYNWNEGWKTRTEITYYWSAKDINAIHEIAKSDFSINIFPNPVSNILNIETKNNDIIPEVKIYSIHGALLLHTKGNKIDISALTNGIYIAIINGECKKIVKN